MTSAAGESIIPESLVLTCFIAFIFYNLAFIFDIDLSAMINFGTTVYQTINKWIGVIRQKGLRATVLVIKDSTVNCIKDTYRSHMYAHAFHTGLEHMISKPTERLGRTILVDTVIISGAGSLALIRGLPSDVSAPELRRYLESILFIQYRNVEHDVDRAATQPESDSTEDSPIDTSRSGLWNGTYVQSKEGNVDTPSTSGINTPASNASASSVPAIDLGLEASTSNTEYLELEDLSPPCALQRRSSSPRAG